MEDILSEAFNLVKETLSTELWDELVKDARTELENTSVGNSVDDQMEDEVPRKDEDSMTLENVIIGEQLRFGIKDAPVEIEMGKCSF
jgi:hypothetical protein